MRTTRISVRSMEQSKIDMFVMANKDCFTNQHLILIKEKLATLPDEKANAIMCASFKNPTTILILSILLGGYGVDRFVLGEIGLGFLKLITCGGCGIWAIIDWFIIRDKTRNYNFDKFNELMML